MLIIIIIMEEQSSSIEDFRRKEYLFSIHREWRMGRASACLLNTGDFAVCCCTFFGDKKSTEKGR
jgi:hypothetical protein